MVEIHVVLSLVAICAGLVMLKGTLSEFKSGATIEVDRGAEGFVFRAVEAREPAHV